MAKKIAWFLFFIIMASACLDEPDCFSLNNYVIGISFKKLVNSTADTVALLDIHTEQPPLLFSADTTISKISLPLNYFENETTFLFEMEDTTRMLRLGYTSKAQFVSENCGERFILSDLRVLEDSFDSVRVLNRTPSKEAGTIHLEIYQ